MTDRNDTRLNLAAQTGYIIFETDRFDPDFSSETDTDVSFVKAYFDKEDGLPVVVCKLGTSKIAQGYNGELHLGALCVTLDIVSTYAAFSNQSWWTFSDDDPTAIELIQEMIPQLYREFGVSRTIKIHRQRPIIAGSDVYISIKILENTPTSTYYACKIFDTDGNLLATGTHDKTKLTKVLKPKL